MTKTILAAAAIAAALSLPAAAQLQSGGSSGGASGGGVSDQGDQAVTKFMGLEVQAKRMIADPSVNGFRLILGMKNTEKETRLASLMAPAPTIVDDMGNLYQIVAVSGGVGVCRQFKEVSASNCRYHDSTNFMRLPSGVEVNMILTFGPVEDRVLEDTLDMVQSASLQARMAYLIEGEDHRKTRANDIIINGLQVP